MSQQLHPSKIFVGKSTVWHGLDLAPTTISYYNDTHRNVMLILAFMNVMLSVIRQSLARKY